jgi:hypothetical protein
MRRRRRAAGDVFVIGSERLLEQSDVELSEPAAAPQVVASSSTEEAKYALPGSSQKARGDHLRVLAVVLTAACGVAIAGAGVLARSDGAPSGRSELAVSSEAPREGASRLQADRQPRPSADHSVTRRARRATDREPRHASEARKDHVEESSGQSTVEARPIAPSSPVPTMDASDESSVATPAPGDSAASAASAAQVRREFGP